jgi:hypothetical protein
MIGRVLIVLAASILVGAVLICVFPAFPPVLSVVDDPYSMLTEKFGASQESAQDTSLPPQLRPKKSVVWRKSRVLAVWELSASYTATPFGPTMAPDSLARCLVWRGVNLHMPCDYAFRARVKVP